MSWYESGSWDGLPVQLCATVLSQILYAINERQAAQGVTVTSWDAPVSTTYPAASDCVMPLSDVSNIFSDAQTAITLLCTAKNPGNVRFVESDYSTQYTISNLLGDGSYGTSWLALDRVQNAQIWLQIREALDLLVYLRGTFTIVNHQYDVKTADSVVSLQDSWTGTLAATPTQSGFGSVPGPLGITRSHTYPFLYRTGIGNNAHFDTGYVLVGSRVSGGSITLRDSYTILTGGGGTASSFTFSDDQGNSWSASSSAGAYTDQTATLEPGTVTFTMPEPATVPMTVTSGSVERAVSIQSIDNFIVAQLIPGTHLTYG